MTDNHIQIRRATETDLQGIDLLQAANQQNVGGTLSAYMSRDWILEAIRTMPVIVAQQDNTLVGFLFISTPGMNRGIPIVKAMLNAFPLPTDTLISGPICISASMRGRGLAHQLFLELGRIRPGLKCACFIRRDNTPSIRAHQKMGMKEVASFPFHDADHAIFTYTVI